MKTVLPWSFFMGIVYIVQTSLLYPLAYDNISGDLIMLTVVFLTTMYGRYALLFGFTGGIFLDLASGSFLGIHTFALIILCLLVDYLANFIHRDNILIPFCVGLFITIGNHLIINTLIYLLGYIQSAFAIVKSLVLSIIYNIVFAYPMWFIMLKIKSVIDKYTVYKPG